MYFLVNCSEGGMWSGGGTWTVRKRRGQQQCRALIIWDLTLEITAPPSRAGNYCVYGRLSSGPASLASPVTSVGLGFSIFRMIASRIFSGQSGLQLANWIFFFSKLDYSMFSFRTNEGKQSQTPSISDNSPVLHTFLTLGSFTQSCLSPS